MQSLVVPGKSLSNMGRQLGLCICSAGKILLYKYGEMGILQGRCGSGAWFVQTLRERWLSICQDVIEQEGICNVPI